MSLIRLDKLLSSMGYGSRKDAKNVLKKGFVSVDGVVVKRPELKIDTEKNVLVVNGDVIEYIRYVYLMMNKPQGVISATEDPYDEDETVVDLLEEKYQWFDLFPVGRLDKDTEGLMILTNDGIFAHRTLTPKKHVAKVYYAKIDGVVTEEDIKAFAEGVTLDDEYQCKPGVLKIVSANQKESEIELEISEGKFHQVKRMFEAVGKKVVFLKRISFAGIALDESLAPGEYRPLNEEEMKLIDNYISKE